jgi:hypothetical protein
LISTALSQLSSSGEPLARLNELIDFQFSARARPPDVVFTKFKIPILQTLSTDDAIGFQLRDRISLMHSLGARTSGRRPPHELIKARAQ